LEVKRGMMRWGMVQQRGIKKGTSERNVSSFERDR